MKFPEYERVVYKNNPLAEVVCQVRFNRLFVLDERVPSGFQKSLGSDYPVAATRELASIRFGGSDDESKVTRQTLYEFITKDKSVRVSLCSEYVAVATEHYSQWESFVEHINRALSALSDNYDPPFYTRIGLRYVNVIDREALGLANYKWSELIRPSIFGIFSEDTVSSDDVIEHNGTSVLKISGGKLGIRHGLTLQDGKPNGRYAIDCDAHCENIEGNKENALGLLRDYNRVARQAFRWIVTERVHNALEPAVGPS